MPKKPTPPISKLKAEFDAAHVAGQAALKAHDFDGVNEAIRREREIIEQQKQFLPKRPRQRQK